MSEHREKGGRLIDCFSAQLRLGSLRQVWKAHAKTHALVTNHSRPTAADPLETLRGSVLRFEAPSEPVVGENDWNALA